ncbi:MAG: hypothetical protein DLM58_24470 [Pseudonocardiales bacterium]|nr:MAG: hypothetical protein DLM58_24470 [Pseudonocardiales bacterium]
MSLTTGTGPFGESTAGEFGSTLQPTDHVMYFELSPRRVRVVVGGETVADSRRAFMLHETGALPWYYLPEADVRRDLLEPSDTEGVSPSRGRAQYWTLRVGDRVIPDAAAGYPEPPSSAPPIAGYLVFDWDAVDAWYEEDEQIFTHPADPYHRVDVRQSTRHVRISLNGEVLAESSRSRLLFETGLPTRYYLPADDVRTGLLTPSDTTTECAYKGTATYWSAQAGDHVASDLAWTYREPKIEAERVRGYVTFFNERVDVDLDGERQPRAESEWTESAVVALPSAD